MRKGNQVKLIGRYPSCGKEGIVKFSWPRIYRHTTAAEVDEWYNSPESKGINCAGESKLPPTVAVVKYNGGTLIRPDLKIKEWETILLSEDDFTVVRARCAPVLGYSKSPGQALVRNNRTGEEGYVKRTHCTLKLIPPRAMS